VRKIACGNSSVLGPTVEPPVGRPAVEPFRSQLWSQLLSLLWSQLWTRTVVLEKVLTFEIFFVPAFTFLGNYSNFSTTL
jgi:hypothetical protein